MVAVKGEWAVVAMVAVGLVMAEAGLRSVQDSLSGDVEHLNQADSIVEAVVEGDGLRLLVIGNSLVFSGVDPLGLESGLERELARDVTVGLVNPDGTGPLEWSYLYRKLLFNEGRLPDVLVMGFGHGHLRDRPPERVLLRLAAHHVDARDIGSLFQRDLTGLEERSAFVLGRVSTAFALRDRIAPRVFDALIPRYRQLAPILLGAPPDDRPPEPAETEPTFEYLGRLLDDASKAGLAVVAMPMPAPEPYPVDRGALDAFAERGAPVLRSNVDTGLEPGRFPDRLHLDAEGGERFTRLLALMLADVITRLELD